MANLKSSIKRARSSEKRKARNLSVRSSIKTILKKAEKAILAKSKDVKEAVLAAISSIDKAVQNNLIHKNKAARLKSRLMKKLNATK